MGRTPDTSFLIYRPIFIHLYVFRFKQFTIRQDRTAMKVCTDACVLGAYADLADTTSEAVRVLDIGTGTGLLALMAAQRNKRAFIDAVEVDDDAYRQATENVAASPFAERVRVWHGRIQNFVPSAPGKEIENTYNRILTNPPFYTNHLRSPDAAVNRALHTSELSFEELITAVVRLLKPNGQWWVLLPPYETSKLTELALQSGLTVFRQLHLHHNQHKSAFRLITGFDYSNRPTEQASLAIHELDSNEYTPAFQTLLRDFYLIF